MSGPRALELGERLIRPWPLATRHATLARVVDSAGESLDEGIVVSYRAPASFTGENAIEFTCHGGPIAPASVAAAFVAAGARPAEAGEFTRRAVLNGKLDLLQAEAVGDLVDASTRAAHRAALAQLDGGLSRRIATLRDHILEVEALAAYDIDFPEEDDGPIPASRIIGAARGVVAELNDLLATAPVGEIVREGAVVVIAGPPNVGKSSLFNALLGRQRAIVTDVPGTTRDALEALTEADGWPIRLIDTAGLRETSETVEQIGIEVSRRYLQDADVVIACGDDQESLEQTVRAVEALSEAPVVTVRTKTDLPGGLAHARASDVLVSAETGAGLAGLSTKLASVLAARAGALRFDAPLLTRERQRVAITRARDELSQFVATFERGDAPAVIAAVHLRDATRELEELIGVVDVEDVLDRLFSSFCVGK